MYFLKVYRKKKSESNIFKPDIESDSEVKSILSEYISGKTKGLVKIEGAVIPCSSIDHVEIYESNKNLSQLLEDFENWNRSNSTGVKIAYVWGDNLDKITFDGSDVLNVTGKFI